MRVTNQKPIIIFGKGESVFNKFYFGGKQWVGASGERSSLPKFEGMDIMASASQPREFGFSMELKGRRFGESKQKESAGC